MPKDHIYIVIATIVSLSVRYQETSELAPDTLRTMHEANLRLYVPRYAA